MKKKEFEALGKKLLPFLPGFNARGALVLAEPVGHILRAIHFDSSRWDRKAFYIDVFFQPLCIPADHIHLTLGFRLTDMSDYDGWFFDRPDLVEEIGKSIKAKALPFLKAASTLEEAARAADGMQPTNTHVQEAAALCWALSGNTSTALDRLDDVIGAMKSHINPGIAWQLDQLQRVEMIKDLLLSNPIELRHKLLGWEVETAQKIGLERFRA